MSKISILETEYIKPTRPYSYNELYDRQKKLYKYLKLSNIKAEHKKCKHFYFVKENGRKEKDIKEQNSPDIGNCSCCWKLNKTPKYLKNKAYDIVDLYCNRFYDNPEITYSLLDLETVFYKWLYTEFYDDKY